MHDFEKYKMTNTNEIHQLPRMTKTKTKEVDENGNRYLKVYLVKI